MKRMGLLTLCVLCMAFMASAQQTKELHILHTSDTHSRIEPLPCEAADEHAGMGGVVRRVTLVKQYRQQHPDMLLLDCGDISQGTPYYNFYKGEVEVRMMNLMKYDAMAIGNHEFDFGMDNLARLIKMADFPVVCANYDVSGTVLDGLVHRYVVLQRAGLRIGLFGLSPRPEGLIQADKCAGIIYSDPIAAAQEVTDILRNKEHCDVVICLSHLGILGASSVLPDDEKLATHTQGIDVILGGHSHTFMKKAIPYQNAAGQEVPVFHTGKNGVFVGEWKLLLEHK